MNIIKLHNNSRSLPDTSKNLFTHMEESLKNSGIDFEKSIRLAKTVAPLLQDQSSNERHLQVINSQAPTQEKVIAIIMLGFPKNRHILPVLQDLLLKGPESLSIAAGIAISQMADDTNHDILTDILAEAYNLSVSDSVKKSLKTNILEILDNKASQIARNYPEL